MSSEYNEREYGGKDPVSPERSFQEKIGKSGITVGTDQA
jgi:hypothetical protein